jgi:hypothetical protein
MMRGDKDEQSGEAAKVAQEPFAGITVADIHPTVNVGFASSRVEFEYPAAGLGLGLEWHGKQGHVLVAGDFANPKMPMLFLTFKGAEKSFAKGFVEEIKSAREDVQAIISNIGRLTQPSSEPAPAPATSGEAKAHVSADFPPRAVVNADVDVLAAGLSSLAVETLGDEGRRRLVAAFRAVMTYDVTQDPVWEEISKLGRATRLYMCDPEPKSFVMEGARRITGRGSILVDYRAEILPGQERDVSVSVPARFHLHCRNGVPEIDRVELRD